MVKWSNPGIPWHHGVVTIKKGVFGSPSTKIANFTYFTLYPRRKTELIQFNPELSRYGG